MKVSRGMGKDTKMRRRISENNVRSKLFNKMRRKFLDDGAKEIRKQGVKEFRK